MEEGIATVAAEETVSSEQVVKQVINHQKLNFNQKVFFLLPAGQKEVLGAIGVIEALGEASATVSGRRVDYSHIYLLEEKELFIQDLITAASTMK